MVRIQFATRSLANIVPGGNAAAATLGYRLLTLLGGAGSDAGFALATAGLGSAVLLNIILGSACSSPSRSAASARSTSPPPSIGVFLIGVFFGIVLSLLHGREQAVKAVQVVARKLRLNPERAAEVVERLADRIKDLYSDKVLLRRVVTWGLLSWLLNAASLWVFLFAFDVTLSLDGLLVSFGLANLFAAIPITPGGLGIVESIYIPTLVAFGVPPGVAVIAVPLYRLAQYWLPTAARRLRLPEPAARPLRHQAGRAPGAAARRGRRGHRQPRELHRLGRDLWPPPGAGAWIRSARPAAPPFQSPGPGWEPR